MKKLRKDIKEIFGLEYMTLKDVPMRKIRKDLTVVDVSPHELERRVVIAIIEYQVPIRGREFKLVKGALGLTFEEIASLLKTSDKTIKNWARKLDDNLPYAYEALVRVLAAERLGVPLEMSLNGVTSKNKPAKIKVSVA